MPSTVIADLLAQGVRLDSAEAVAVAQQLIAQLTGSVDLTTPPDEPLLGPPSAANVLLHHDGSVTCLGCQVKPAVFEIAVLLHSLLPSGTGQVPGGLRYAIARGLHDVDAPPFDSIEDFSKTLARFERGDRAAIIRGVLARAISQTPVHAFGRSRAAVATPVQRRRTAPAAAVLRRELHNADRRLFEQRAALAKATQAPVAVPPQPEPVPAVAQGTTKQARWYLPAVAAVFFGGVALAGVADLVHLRGSRQPARAAIETPAPAPRVANVAAEAMPTATASSAAASAAPPTVAAV